MVLWFSACAVGFFVIASAFAQNLEAPPPLQLVQPPGQAAPPPVITLQDALDRAKNLDGRVQSAMADAAVARDPNYANAYRLKARALELLGTSYPKSAAEMAATVTQAELAARRATSTSLSIRMTSQVRTSVLQLKRRTRSSGSRTR